MHSRGAWPARGGDLGELVVEPDTRFGQPAGAHSGGGDGSTGLLHTPNTAQVTIAGRVYAIEDPIRATPTIVMKGS